MNKPMMMCGHASNATNSKGDPVCVICVGIDPGAEIVDAPPTLEGREAICVYCNNIKPSNIYLAFFEHRPNRVRDFYYCGCRGWD